MAIAQSIRDKILENLVAAMNAGETRPALCYRTRVEAFNSTQLPAYVLFVIESSPERKGPHITYHDMTVRLECLMAGEAPMDQALDPMLVYAVQTMFSACNALTSVKGLAEGQTQWEIDPAYDNVAVGIIDFRVTFATLADDPSTER